MRPQARLMTSAVHFVATAAVFGAVSLVLGLNLDASEPPKAWLGPERTSLGSSPRLASLAPSCWNGGMKVREVLKRLDRDGWAVVRTRGGHRQLKHPVKAGTVTVAGHPGDDVHPKSLVSIWRQARLGDES